MARVAVRLLASGSWEKRAAIERYLMDTVRSTIEIAALGTPPFVDGQIAAVARVNRLILVTRNVADFHGFEGLAIEDWTK